MTEYPNRHDIEIIRGDNYELWVGLAAGWTDIEAAPGNYLGRMAFRLDQSDAASDLVSTTSDLVSGSDPNFPDLKYLLKFALTTAQTAALPSYDVVCYTEIRNVSGSVIRRLFDGRVRVRD